MDREEIIGEALELLGDMEGLLYSLPSLTEEQELLLVRVQRTLDRMAQYGAAVYEEGIK
jgi:hypothetical protein